MRRCTSSRRGGYHGTSTEAIAKRVGVSQPYLFRLFPNKKAIFLAAAERCLEDTPQVFAEAAEGLHGEEALQAMADAYTRLIAERPGPAADADADVRRGGRRRGGRRPRVRRGRPGRLDGALGHRPPAAGRATSNETTTFMAYGMLINVLAAMGFPPGHRVWEGLYPSARAKGRPEK